MTICMVYPTPTTVTYVTTRDQPKACKYVTSTYRCLEAPVVATTIPKCQEEPIFVTIATMDGHEEVLCLKTSVTIQDLKEHIKLLKMGHGVQVADMRLHHAGLQLNDGSATLAKCGIAAGSKVEMVVTKRQKPRKARVFLRTTSETKPFDVDLSTLVAEAAKTATEQCGLDGTYVLTFRGRVLDGSKSLKDAGVEMGNVMKLMPEEG
ncbi:unnamed protein product [Effrenium voratum]|uniref:Ubiquitin-like domain-containing protein n=1 Tax=Effrenium voratum TaxID=2562239 RepID=A0AA36NI13_9DINO|nr:unnamed protein product [Effrenium voratum]CAJ1404511.1 unnamed protein product [Effrenium voratum]